MLVLIKQLWVIILEYEKSNGQLQSVEMLLRCSRSFYLFRNFLPKYYFLQNIVLTFVYFLLINFEKLFERFIHRLKIFWSNPLPFPYPPIPPQSLPLISPPNFICTFTFITHWIHLVLVSMCLGVGQSFGVWVVFWPHSWRKRTLPPRQLSIASGFSARAGTSRTFAGILSGLLLCRSLYMQTQLFWVHVFNGLVLSSELCLAVDFHYLWLLLSSHSLFCAGPWNLRGVVWCHRPI